MKVTDRDQGASKFLQDLKALKADLSNIHHVSQGWAQTSRATALLKAIERETAQLEAHIVALVREVNTMDSVCHEMRGGITVNTLKQIKKKEADQPRKSMVQSSTNLKTVSPKKFLDLQRARHGLATSNSTSGGKMGDPPSSRKMAPVSPPSAPRPRTPEPVEPPPSSRKTLKAVQEPVKPPPSSYKNLNPVEERTVTERSGSRVSNLVSGLPKEVLKQLKDSGIE